MGYYNYFRGGLAFKPNITDQQAHDLEEQIEQLELDGYNSFRLAKRGTRDDKRWIIEWDECDSKYDWYEIWITAIVNLVKDQGLSLSGNLLYRGEDYLDNGFIHVKNNQLKILRARYDENVECRGQEGDFGNISWRYPECNYPID